MKNVFLTLLVLLHAAIASNAYAADVFKNLTVEKVFVNQGVFGAKVAGSASLQGVYKESSNGDANGILAALLHAQATGKTNTVVGKDGQALINISNADWQTTGCGNELYCWAKDIISVWVE